MNPRIAISIVAFSVLVCATSAGADTETLDDLLARLFLDKPPIIFSDPQNGGDTNAEQPVTQPVPSDFGGGTGTLNNRGGSLVILEATPPGGVPSDLTTLSPQYISDILLFLPNATTFFMFSDPFPEVFHVPTYDSTGAVTGEAFLTLADVLSTANNRRVNTLQEGFLFDQRPSPPLGAGPIDIFDSFQLPDVTIFVNRFTTSTSQAYVILSDNPVPEPASLALFAAGLLAFAMVVARRARH